MHRHGITRRISARRTGYSPGKRRGLPAPDVAAQAATPTADCPATTPAENLAVVRSFYEEGVNGADLSVFDRVAAPDIVYYGATVGDESGLEALKRIYGEALTGFPGIQYTLLTSVADGDAVALRYSVEGVHSGDFRGLAPTGNTITWNHSTFAHVACGRISEMWAEIDQLDRLREFGILAAEGPAARMAGAASWSRGNPGDACGQRQLRSAKRGGDHRRRRSRASRGLQRGEFRRHAGDLCRRLPARVGERTGRDRDRRGGATDRGFRDRAPRPGMDVR